MGGVDGIGWFVNNFLFFSFSCLSCFWVCKVWGDLFIVGVIWVFVLVVFRCLFFCFSCFNCVLVLIFWVDNLWLFVEVFLWDFLIIVFMFMIVGDFKVF